MKGKWLVRAIIGTAAFIICFFAAYRLADAAPTACQIGNGCTGTSTAPAYG